MFKLRDQIPQSDGIKAEHPPWGPAPVADMWTEQFPADAPHEPGDAEGVTAVSQPCTWCFHHLCLLQVPKRTGLIDNHTLVIKTFHDGKGGRIDGQTMASRLRLSRHLMAAALEVSRDLDPVVAGTDSILAKRLFQLKIDCYEACYGRL